MRLLVAMSHIVSGQCAVNLTENVMKSAGLDASGDMDPCGSKMNILFKSILGLNTQICLF